jgi:short-subunit dehydrogenase
MRHPAGSRGSLAILAAPNKICSTTSRAKRGFDLILVARSVEPLKALAASLSSASGRHITSIVADLNNETDLAKVETKLKDDPSITMLLNNAGFASVAPLLEADIRKMQDMIALNVTALTRLTYAAAPAFVKRGTGTIINIGSAAGISVEALNGVYGASKAYVLAFSLSLQYELTSKGIRVQAVLPGRTATDGWEVAGLPWHSNPRRSSCRWKTWSMQRWSASIWANWSQFPAFIMETNGHALRPHAAPCCRSSALPSPRPATGIKREGRHK